MFDVDFVHKHTFTSSNDCNGRLSINHNKRETEKYTDYFPKRRIKSDNAKRSIPAHPIIVKDVHSDLDLRPPTSIGSSHLG